MSRIRRRWYGTFFGVSLALGGFTEWARGDSLAAKLDSDEVLLYEPIIVHVELHLDEAFLPPEMLDDPYEANRQLWRIHRRVNLELRDPGGQKISRAFLLLEFPRPSNPARVVAATGFAFLGQADTKTNEFHHWAQAGVFTLVVIDEESGLESNEMPITFKIVSGREFEAAQIFKQSGLDGMLAALLAKQPRRAESIDLFRRLAEDYPETVYAKYARASLALLRWEDTARQHKDKGGSEVWAPVVDELVKASRLFDGAHPLRERVLFRLAQAQLVAGNPSDARRTAELLCTKLPDSEFARKAKEMLTKLDE